MGGTDQDEHYTWKLIISDGNENREEIAVNVTLHPPVRDLIELSFSRSYDITISKADLMTRFIGPVNIQLEPESSALIETQALNHITISPTFNIREYVKNNILIGSVPKSVDKSELYETVGIGNAVSPSNDYPLDIAAGGNHLKMDNEGALNFGKVILDTNTSNSNYYLPLEMGLYIINFVIDPYSDTSTEYTAVLSLNNDTNSPSCATVTGFGETSYTLMRNSSGYINVANKTGMPEKIIIRKIIKIMSY